MLVRGTDVDTSNSPEGLQEGMPFTNRIRKKRPLKFRAVFICGGLAPLVNQPDPVYRKLFGRNNKTSIITDLRLKSEISQGRRKKPGILSKVPRRHPTRQANRPIPSEDRSQAAFWRCTLDPSIPIARNQSRVPR